MTVTYRRSRIKAIGTVARCSCGRWVGASRNQEHLTELADAHLGTHT